MPSHLEHRLDAVLSVLYLVFNEGYLGRGEGLEPMRVDLCEEALRLTRSLVDLLPDYPEIYGLLALELFHHARRDARLDTNADLVLLPNQDRNRWHQPGIEQGNVALRHAMALRAPGRYQIQAMIAGYHTNARNADDTDWKRIAALYDRLVTIDPSPIVALNRAVAIGMAESPQAGLAALPDSDDLVTYHLFQAAEAALHLMAGNINAAKTAFATAHRLARNPAEIRHLDRRIADTI